MDIFKKKSKGIYLLIDLRSTLPEKSKRIKLVTERESWINFLTHHNGDKGVIYIYNMVTDKETVNQLEKMDLIFPSIPLEMKKQFMDGYRVDVKWEEIKKYLI